MVLPVHALQTGQVRLKSVSNEGHFTLEVEKVFHLYLPKDFSGVTEQYMVLPVHMLQTVPVRLKSVSNKGNYTLEVETVVLPYLA
jgi:hypothetical protein